MSEKPKPSSRKVATPKQKTITLIKGTNNQNESNDIIPEKLKIYVTQEIWDSWSPIRRNSFKQIIKNPNSFFYRNRPPGDPQKCGQFSAEEEKQFLERLKYFRNDLGIDDGLWGLFSVPILGRLGYQCSNFYRLLIKNGKVIDDHYEIQPDGKLKFIHGNSRANPSPEVVRILEKEAFDFIEKCLKPEDGEVPKVSKPIIVQSEPSAKSSNNTKPFKKVSKEITKYLGHRRLLKERRDIQQPVSFGAKGYGYNNRDRNFLSFFESNICPVFGALDPMSEEPIETPMMDSNGFVMDLKSWRRVFRHNEMAPCEMVACDESELIELNSRNFNELRLHISNIIC